MAEDKGLTYKDAGVDIDAGNALVDRIKPLVAATRRPEVLHGIGGFGGLFALAQDRYQQPVLVSGTDGVGTKLKLAQQFDQHDTIGIDLVAMCVNDVIVQGAEPLFFLDYFATGKLEPQQAEKVIAGIATGCQQAGCALIGGETAEMPDMYANGDYDLAGFNVGVVERSKLIDGNDIRTGNTIIGIQSSGPHSNGYSLIRKVLEHSKADLDLKIGDKTLRQALIEPTQIYVKLVLSVLREIGANGLAHITGGGLTENIIRIVPEGMGIEIDLNTWQQPEIFNWLQSAGNINQQEMLRTFNCGIGFCVITQPEKAEQIIDIAADFGLSAWSIGQIVQSEGERVNYI